MPNKEKKCCYKIKFCVFMDFSLSKINSVTNKCTLDQL